MATKLGAHVLRMSGQTQAFIDAGPAVVKFAGEWGAAAGVPQGTLIIGRKVADDDAQSQRASGRSPAEAANEFIYRWKQLDTYKQNPAIIYWEGHNEPVWSDHDGMGWYAQMEIERMKLMEAQGLKCVIGNFATGTPPLDLWSSFIPACRYALEHGHILGLHEYSTPFIWWMTGKYQVNRNENCRTSDGRLAGWTILRYRQVYDQFLKPAGLDSLSLVITENGLDPMVGPVPDGWPIGTFKHLGSWWNRGPAGWGYPLPSDFAPEDGWHTGDLNRFYQEQLWWYDQQLLQDPYVIGTTIFTFGSFSEPWASFDVAGMPVADMLVEYVRTAKAAGGQPAPQPSQPITSPPSVSGRPRGAPRVQYERTFLLFPPGTGPEWLAAVASLVLQRGWSVGTSPDDAGLGDLNVRRVIAINPSRIGTGLTAAWYNEHYPGVQFTGIEANSPSELLAKL